MGKYTGEIIEKEKEMTLTRGINGSVHYFQWNPETLEIIESVGTGSMVVGYARSQQEFEDEVERCDEELEEE